MSATYSFSPRKPGCVLLAADIRSLVSKIIRVWQKPVKESGRRNMKTITPWISAKTDTAQQLKGRINRTMT